MILTGRNHMARMKKKKQSNNAAESSSQSVVAEKKAPPTLKAKRKLVKKFSHLDTAETKETEISPQVQAKNKGKKAKDGNQGNNVGGKDANRSQTMNEGNKELGSISERHREKNKDAKAEKPLGLNESRGQVDKDAQTVNSLGGVIFMCNAKTKEDCYRYRVMGVSASKQDLVMGVKPGFKLFLYDFDLKLMYGIYEASSAGGMRIEPAAFGGAFPAQVPFRIHKDCIPLPENVFKKAIKDNYDEKTRKFKTELTVKQVEKLTELFRPINDIAYLIKKAELSRPGPLLHPTPNPVLQDPVAQPVIQRSAAAPLSGYEPSREHVYGAQHSSSNFKPYDHERQQVADHYVMPREVSHHPQFLTEKEYRSYGLQQAKHLQHSAFVTHVNHKLDHYGSEQGREQLLRDPVSVRGDGALARNGTVYSNRLYPSEEEYRTYGLKSCYRQQPVTVAPTLESSSAVAAAASQSILSHGKDTYNPYDESTTSLVNRYLSLPRTTIAPGQLPLTVRESLASDSNYLGDVSGHPGGLLAENGSLYPPNAPHALLGHGQILYQHPRDEPRKSSAVLSQYPFAGSSASRR